jgi:two-component sensor histidine kinase
LHIRSETGHRDVSGGWLLLSEMGHRIANEYAFVIGSLSLASTRTADTAAKAELDRAIDRLHAYARAHLLLSAPERCESVDLSDYLERVCEAIVRSTLHERGITLTIVSDPVEIDTQRSWRVAMIVSELITNAVRHAFGVSGGEILVDVKLVGEEVQCRVSDSGRPTCGGSPGRGSEIVVALTHDISGSIMRAYGERGATVLLSFPRRAHEAQS